MSDQLWSAGLKVGGKVEIADSPGCGVRDPHGLVRSLAFDHAPKHPLLAPQNRVAKAGK